VTIAAAGRGSHIGRVRLDPDDMGAIAMRYLLMAGLGLMTFAATMTFEPQEANAVVCARGVYRAGCVGYRGGAVVRRPVAAPARVCRTVWRGRVRRTVCY
jgi:hypothetical protein